MSFLQEEIFIFGYNRLRTNISKRILSSFVH